MKRCLQSPAKKTDCFTARTSTTTLMSFDPPAIKAITDGNSEQFESMKNPVTQPWTTGIQWLQKHQTNHITVTSQHFILPMMVHINSTVHYIVPHFRSSYWERSKTLANMGKRLNEVNGMAQTSLRAEWLQVGWNGDEMAQSAANTNSRWIITVIMMIKMN